MAAVLKILGAVTEALTVLLRLGLPFLAVAILVRCGKSLLGEKQENESWACLCLPSGDKLELVHWENVVGRAAGSDISLQYPTLSRSHAAIIRDDAGTWTLHDLHSKGGTTKNGKPVDGPTKLKNGDLLRLAGVDMVFVSKSAVEERKQAEARPSPGRLIRPGGTLWLVTLFQAILLMELLLSADGNLPPAVPIGFGVLCALMWVWYGVTRGMHRTGYEVETLAFFLTTVGFSVVATSAPDSMIKYTLLLVAAFGLFAMMGWFLRSLERAVKLRWPIAAAGIGFLAVNLLLGKVTHGAQNWLSIGGFSLQPSELVKLCFVFAGAATMDRLFARRNLFLFIGYSAVCVGALALMSDFGTAVVFFVTYLVIAFVRSGDFAAVFLSVGGAGLGGLVVLTAKPYIASRFSTWGHAWESVNDSGYQQVRTMSAAAGGGLFGGGAGSGWLKNVFAADTDMVFGVVWEELGLIVALCCVAAVLLLTVFVIVSSQTARSSFYVISSAASVTILLTQIILNVFGSLDVIPFTGVTFPFVSKGGSSLLCCWGLMAFIKAADTRQNASFAIRLPKKPKKRRVKAADREETA